MASSNGKNKRYTDADRAAYVLMVLAAGYPQTKGALTRVSKRTGIPWQTLGRWARSESNPPPNDIVHRKKIDFREAIEEEMSAILGDMKQARPDAHYASLATAFGIMFDKRQLLTGGATENSDRRLLVVYAD